MKKPRYEILDGLRGYFLVFMMLNHLLFTGGFMLQHANHAELGYVQDAQGFVFLSGLIIGLLYTRMALRGSLSSLWDKARYRARDLFVYNAIVVGIVLLLAVLLPASKEFWGNMLGVYGEPGVRAISALFMLYQPSFMDILPQYVLYVLISPFLVWLVIRGHWLEVIGASFLLWFAVQLGVHVPLAQSINNLGSSFAPGFKLRAAFNPLAWQVLFVGGLVLGALVQDGKLEIQRLMRPDRTGVLWLCLVLVGMFMLFRLGGTLHFLPEPLLKRVTALDNRTELSLVYVVNFIATGYVVSWLLSAGAQARSRVAQLAARGLRRIFSLPFLNFLGKHSLQVYAYHVVVVYLVVWGDWAWGPFDQATKTMIGLSVIASLYLPAKIHDLYVSRKARGKVPATGLAVAKPDPAEIRGAT